MTAHKKPTTGVIREAGCDADRRNHGSFRSILQTVIVRLVVCGLLHGDGIPAGSFGDWRTGFTQTWRADIGRTLNHAEETAHRTKVEAMRREREAEEARRKAEAQIKAAAIWKAATLASADHPYLVRKGIKENGAKLHEGALVIPMCSDSKIHSLQFINTDGDKKFLTGGRVTGCYFSIGTTKDAAALCIAEGFATGATIHETTGYPVAVAFNAGNLLAVTKAMREKFPALPLIVCADDDSQTEGNPGLTKATEAARAMGGLLAKPDFGTDRPDGATDFNDLHQAQGLEAVKRAIAGVLDSGDAMNQPEQTNAPEPLPALPAVLSFDYDYLPDGLRGFVSDISERMQCPPDFAAVGAFVMMATIIGRKVGIRPMPGMKQ